jgi:hypothetical protein
LGFIRAGEGVNAQSFPLRDFSAVFANYIKPDGTFYPPICFAPIGGPINWSADPDGLIMTVPVVWLDYEQCLLTALFPMAVGAAAAKCRQRRFPVTPSTWVTVRRMIDEVVGHSGERYSRFAVEVFEV